MLQRIIKEIGVFCGWLSLAVPEVLITVLVVVAAILGAQFLFN